MKTNEMILRGVVTVVGAVCTIYGLSVTHSAWSLLALFICVFALAPETKMEKVKSKCPKCGRELFVTLHCEIAGVDIEKTEEEIQQELRDNPYPG